MSNLTHEDVLRMSRNFKKGQPVSFTRKDRKAESGWYEGEGELVGVWLAMDCVAFKIRDVRTGRNINVFPELGDSIAHTTMADADEDTLI